MQKIIEGMLLYVDSGGYEGVELRIDDSFLENELIDFENKKVRITIEEIK